MCEGNELDEIEHEALLAALEQTIRRDEKRGHAPYWHADNATQCWMEVHAVMDWAREMNRLGRRIDIRSIQKNSEDYPDCLAKMSEEPIGIEVTELVDREAIREHSKLRESFGPGTHCRGFPNSPIPIWDLDNFHKKLDKIVGKKDLRVRDSSLVSQFLLIVTDEPWLDEETVSVYLKELKLKRSKALRSDLHNAVVRSGFCGQGATSGLRDPVGRIG